MSEISEKELPFKLPVHKHLIFPQRFNILDATGHRVVRDITEAEADFICLACNSYKDLMEAGENLLKVLGPSGYFPVAGKPRTDALRAALGKGDTNESD